MQVSFNYIAENLIHTVARAFYTDNFVVVLDALVREKYIIEEELVRLLNPVFLRVSLHHCITPLIMILFLVLDLFSIYRVRD